MTLLRNLHPQPFSCGENFRSAEERKEVFEQGLKSAEYAVRIGLNKVVRVTRWFLRGAYVEQHLFRDFRKHRWSVIGQWQRDTFASDGCFEYWRCFACIGRGMCGLWQSCASHC